MGIDHVGVTDRVTWVPRPNGKTSPRDWDSGVNVFSGGLKTNAITPLLAGMYPKGDVKV